MKNNIKSTLLLGLDLTGTYSAFDNQSGVQYNFEITSQRPINNSTSHYQIEGKLTIPGFGDTGKSSTGYAVFGDSSDPTAVYVSFTGIFDDKSTLGTATANGYSEDYTNKSNPLYLTIAATKPLPGRAHYPLSITLQFTK
ncbi:MAG: hypothetical protein AB4372_13810 [Xenococcus sp. (in: cyanobacteria)]